MFKIIIDDLDDHTTYVDNGLRLSNGTSPSPSANESESFKSSKHKSIKENEQQSLYLSSSELFMNNQSYVTPGAELLASSTNNVDPKSGKEILYIFLEVDQVRIKMQSARARSKSNYRIKLWYIPF